MKLSKTARPETRKTLEYIFMKQLNVTNTVFPGKHDNNPLYIHFVSSQFPWDEGPFYPEQASSVWDEKITVIMWSGEAPEEKAAGWRSLERAFLGYASLANRLILRKLTCRLNRAKNGPKKAEKAS